MRKRPLDAVADRMDDLPVARSAWLPIDAAIRRWVDEGSLAVRVVEGVEFVRLHQLREQAERPGVGDGPAFS